MTDREKLIQLIEGALEHASKQCEKLDSCCACPHGERGGCQSAFILDYLISNSVTFATDTNAGSKWISVEDEMPHAECGESDNVLTVAENGLVQVLYFDGGCWCYPTGETVLYKDPSWRITHWMPMPEPPRVQEVPNGTDHA